LEEKQIFSTFADAGDFSPSALKRYVFTTNCSYPKKRKSHFIPKLRSPCEVEICRTGSFRDLFVRTMPVFSRSSRCFRV